MDIIHDVRFKHPSNVILSGSTGSGKTFFTSELIKNLKSVINPVPRYVVICYAEKQPLYEEIKNNCPVPLKFIKGFDQKTYDTIPRNTLLILDDIYFDVKEKDLINLFVRGSHHRKITNVLIVHNLFPKTMRTVSVNTQYFVMFKNCRDLTPIKVFGRQMGYKKDFLLNVYKHATEENHSYLIVNLRSDCHKYLKLLAKLFEKNPTVYVEEDEK